MRKYLKRTSKNKFPGQQGNTLIILGVILLLLVVGAYYFLEKQNVNDQDYSQAFITTFAECAQLKGSEIVKTYPQQCKTADKITYIEKVKEPVDTPNWASFNLVKGFTFKCPPSWNCQKYRDTSATIYQNHYSNISTFQLNLITSENFQQSFIRHPNYNTPMAWFNAVKAKNESAVKALPITIKSVPGTDGLDYPVYYNYDLKEMREIDTDSGKGIILPARDSNPNTSIVIPINDRDVVLVLLSPANLYKDPIIKAILASIKP